MRSQSDAFIDRSCATISRWEWSRSQLDQINESALSRDQTFHSQRAPNCFDLRRGQWKFVLTLHWHDLEPIVKSHQSLPIGLQPPSWIIEKCYAVAHFRLLLALQRIKQENLALFVAKELYSMFDGQMSPLNHSTIKRSLHYRPRLSTLSALSVFTILRPIMRRYSR